MHATLHLQVEAKKLAIFLIPSPVKKKIFKKKDMPRPDLINLKNSGDKLFLSMKLKKAKEHWSKSLNSHVNKMKL